MATAKKTKPETVAVEYVGPNRGLIERAIIGPRGSYVWNIANNYVANVPQILADDLTIDSDFEIKGEE